MGKKTKEKIAKEFGVGSVLSLNKLLEITKGIKINILSSYKDPDQESRSYIGHFFAADKDELKESAKALAFLHSKKRYVKVVSNNWINAAKPSIHVAIIGDKRKAKKTGKHKKSDKKFNFSKLITITKTNKDAKSKNIHRKSKG